MISWPADCASFTHFCAQPNAHLPPLLQDSSRKEVMMLQWYTQGDRVYWYHASFPDFIFDPARSKFDNLAFWCNEPAHHNLLAESCFRVMRSGLQFNMGDIQSSFLLDSDDSEALSERVNNNISAVLRYSTWHWTHHLPSSQLVNTNNLLICISEFLQIRVLFWIEAMNLLELRNHCTSILQHARGWVLKV